MNSKAFTLALVIAGFSMFMVYSYVEDQTKVMTQKYGIMETVIVAKNDINELELIDDSKVMTTTVPAKFLSPGHFKTVRELENTIATVPILKGEQITKPRVSYPGQKTGLSRQVSNGYRAVAILVDDRQSVGKLIKPGDRVDVLAKIEYVAGEKDRQMIKTILEDVLVLSTGFNVSNSIPLIGMKMGREIKKMNLNTYQRYNTVSLELTPFQAQKMTHVIKFLDPKPFLSLRNNNDKQIVRSQPTRLYDILGEDKTEAIEYFRKKRKK
jgi:pilus assembly protein CpaB